MQANFPSSITASLILHALAAAAVVLAATFIVQQQDARPAAVFVLVSETASLAGPQTGDQPRLKIPAVHAPAPSATTEPRAPEKVMRQQPAATKGTAPVSKVGSANRETANQRPVRPNSSSRPAPAAATSRPGADRVDYATIVEQLRHEAAEGAQPGIAGRASTGAGQDPLSAYTDMLKAALAAAHEPPPGVRLQLAAKVTFDITAGGVILNPRITLSSGSKEFDDSVIAAFRKVRSIGPTPNGKPDTFTLTFDMKDAG